MQQAPVIARLRARHQLNILGMEALAAAVQLDARVVLSARSPRLEDALLVEARTFEVIGRLDLVSQSGSR